MFGEKILGDEMLSLEAPGVFPLFAFRKSQYCAAAREVPDSLILKEYHIKEWDSSILGAITGKSSSFSTIYGYSCLVNDSNKITLHDMSGAVIALAKYKTTKKINLLRPDRFDIYSYDNEFGETLRASIIAEANPRPFGNRFNRVFYVGTPKNKLEDPVDQSSLDWHFSMVMPVVPYPVL